MILIYLRMQLLCNSSVASKTVRFYYYRKSTELAVSGETWN